MPEVQGGVAGKWAALTEERDELKEVNKGLMARVSDLEQRIKVYDGSDVARLAEEQAQLQARVSTLRTENAASMLTLTEDEQEAMDAINALMRVVLNRWKLRTNYNEFIAGIHVLQGFVIQRMLSRLAPKQWKSWYADGKENV